MDQISIAIVLSTYNNYLQLYFTGKLKKNPCKIISAQWRMFFLTKLVERTHKEVKISISQKSGWTQILSSFKMKMSEFLWKIRRAVGILLNCPKGRKVT